MVSGRAAILAYGTSLFIRERPPIPLHHLFDAFAQRDFRLVAVSDVAQAVGAGAFAEAPFRLASIESDFRRNSGHIADQIYKIGNRDVVVVPNVDRQVDLVLLYYLKDHRCRVASVQKIAPLVAAAPDDKRILAI